MYVIARGQWNNTKAFSRLPVLWKTKLQSKITWNQVCILARQNLSQFFYGKTLSTDILRLHLVMKNDFPKKSELSEFILLVKISWLNFSAVSRVEMNSLQKSEKAHFLVLQLCPSISHLQLCRLILCSKLCMLVLQCEPACRLGSTCTATVFWHAISRRAI